MSTEKIRFIVLTGPAKGERFALEPGTYSVGGDSEIPILVPPGENWTLEVKHDLHHGELILKVFADGTERDPEKIGDAEIMVLRPRSSGPTVRTPGISYTPREVRNEHHNKLASKLQERLRSMWGRKSGGGEG